MKRHTLFLIAVALATTTVQNTSIAQVRWSVGGNMGIVIATSPSSADLGFGPMAEVLFGRGPAVGTEFNLVTATGTPIDWSTYFKYYFTIPGSKVKPYADAGFGLVFLTGGPYFNIRFGGGANFEIAHNLFVAPDLQLGPIFASGTTVFNIAIRGGIRYEVQ